MEGGMDVHAVVDRVRAALRLIGPRADAEQIRRVALTYARAIDAREWEAARECFHPEAVVVAPNWVRRAHDEYAERLGGTSLTDLSRWTDLTTHYVLSTFVEMERPGEALAESRCLANHRTSLPL